MNSDGWDSLAQPFPPGEVQWRVETLSRDKRRALVVPYVDARTVLDRLDEVLGSEGWQDSYQVLLAEGGNYAVKCRLSLVMPHSGPASAGTQLEVSKEDVGEGDSLKAAFSDALKRAAVKFGIGRYLYRLDKQWVDYDPESEAFEAPRLEGGRAVAGSPSLEPREPVREQTQEANPGSTPPSPPQPGTHPPSPQSKPEPQELIDRLMERLKESGMGKQAAQVITKYGGYGKTPDETRRLYGELRALLKGQS